MLLSCAFSISLPFSSSSLHIIPTGQSPLHIAARNASVAIIELLLLHDAVLDLNDVEGMTPIHLASVAGSRESLGVMVKRAGDAVLSLPNSISGMTPLMYACLYGHDSLTKYFVKKKVCQSA